MSKLSPDIKAGIILGLGVVVVAAVNLVWATIETRPPHWDMARHLWTSLQYIPLLRDRPDLLLEAYQYYPPFIYIVAAAFYLVFGTSIVAAVAANNMILAGGAAAVYALGRRVGSRATALLGALLFLSTPLMASQGKEFQIDGPLAALTAITLWLLVRSPDFTERWTAAGLGAVMGVGMLCKWTYPVAVMLPLVYCLGLASWRTWHDRRWGRLLNIMIAAVIAVAIAWYWYYAHRQQLRLDLLSNGVDQARREGDPTGITPAAMSYYGLALLSVQLYVVPFGLFVVGMWQAIRRHSQTLIVLLLAVAGTYGGFSIIGNKDARYTLPFMAAVVVLATFWLSKAPRRWRAWAQAGVGIYAGLTFWAMSFGLPGLPHELALSVAGQRLVLWAQHGYIISQPSHETWHLEEAMQIAAGSSLVYYGPDTIWFNKYDLQYYAERYRVDLYQPADKAGWVMTRGIEHDTQVQGQTALQKQLPDGTWLSLYRSPTTGFNGR